MPYRIRRTTGFDLDRLIEQAVGLYFGSPITFVTGQIGPWMGGANERQIAVLGAAFGFAVVALRSGGRTKDNRQHLWTGQRYIGCSRARNHGYPGKRVDRY